MRSKFLSVNARDFLMGFAVSVFAQVTAVLYTSIQAGQFIFDWNAIAMAAVVGALGYLQTKLVTNSQGEILKKEPTKETDDIQPTP
jgi:hypothetical protein